MSELFFDSNPRLDEAPVLMLVDGHSLAFRSYYAFAKSKKGALRTSSGIPTSVCFGFLNSLFKVLEYQQPQYLAIAFDRGEPTFRHQADATYKADRKETPEEFILDLDNLKELLHAFNLKTVTASGYEADDVIATLAKIASEANYQVHIVSGDRDLFQLVDDRKNISVIYLDNYIIKNNDIGVYSEFHEAEVEQKMGVRPDQIVDYKALSGDKSDNIPGVKGIGERTAVKLLSEYGTVEAIYQNLDKIKGAIKDKLENGKEEAKHSQYLARLSFDAPIDLKLEEYKLQGFALDKVEPLLQKLEFKTFLQKIDTFREHLGQPSEKPSSSIAVVLDKKIVEEISIVAVEVQIIDTPDKLDELVNLLKNLNSNHLVAWDTETTSLEPMDAQLVGISCCWGTKPTEVAYIPVNHKHGNCLDREQILSALRPILEAPDYPKVLQNAKYDRVVFRHQGIELAGVRFDPMLASYVLSPEQTHNLRDLCDRYLDAKIRTQNYKDLNIPKGKTIAELDVETVANYSGTDAYATLCLVFRLRAELEKVPQLAELFFKVEIPLEPVLAEMEDRGVRVDTIYLQELSGQLETNLQTIEQQAYREAGQKFNIGSPKQLSEILFEKLQLNRKKSRKTKTGYSTDHVTLEKLRGDHPLIERILEYRTLTKLKSTYVDELLQLVRKDTGRVHTDFNQAVTTTGRLSSSNPNLQNIPIRTEFSRQIRKAFIPEEGWLLVSADYSQIELRILAHLSQEPLLVEAYNHNRDVHSLTARLLFEKETVTPEERNLGKTINFGVIYGMGAQRFAREAKVSAEEGKKFIEKYRQRYGRVFAYLERMKKEALARGYVSTILGRRRYFDFASESLRRLRGSACEDIDLDRLKIERDDAQLLRAAANAPIQGSSADIIKVAMIRLQEILTKYRAKLLLQVHDELVFEIPPEEWEELQPQIKSTMENALTLSVPLVVDLRVGQNWMEAK